MGNGAAEAGGRGLSEVARWWKTGEIDSKFQAPKVVLEGRIDG